MIGKIDKLEDEYIDTLNLIMTLDNALQLAHRDNDDFAHLHTLSSIIVEKSEYIFELVQDVSSQLYALHSEKNARH